MGEHHLKAWPEYFHAVKSGKKTFEVRKDDRGFAVGDRLHLMEYEGGRYTGRSINREVLYILSGGQFGVQTGYVVMALSREG